MAAGQYPPSVIGSRFSRLLASIARARFPFTTVLQFRTTGFFQDFGHNCIMSCTRGRFATGWYTSIATNRDRRYDSSGKLISRSYASVAAPGQHGDPFSPFLSTRDETARIGVSARYFDRSREIVADKRDDVATPNERRRSVGEKFIATSSPAKRRSYPFQWRRRLFARIATRIPEYRESRYRCLGHDARSF